MFSKTELLPLLCEPITTIYISIIYNCLILKFIQLIYLKLYKLKNMN